MVPVELVCALFIFDIVGSHKSSVLLRNDDNKRPNCSASSKQFALLGSTMTKMLRSESLV